MKFRRRIEELILQVPEIKEIVADIHAQKGTALLVGGAVRDIILNVPLKDIDIEVHGLTIDSLEQILGQFGPVSLVGKAFGVLRVHGLDIDWSIPRADAPGRKPKVTLDPHMTFQDAFARRDLTINAMGI